MGELDGGHAVLFASGMAAISARSEPVKDQHGGSWLVGRGDGGEDFGGVVEVAWGRSLRVAVLLQQGQDVVDGVVGCTKDLGQALSNQGGSVYAETSSEVQPAVSG
jgi:hypothetical protein